MTFYNQIILKCLAARNASSSILWQANKRPDLILIILKYIEIIACIPAKGERYTQNKPRRCYPLSGLSLVYEVVWMVVSKINQATAPKLAIQDQLFLSMAILQNNHHTIIISYYNLFFRVLKHDSSCFLLSFNYHALIIIFTCEFVYVSDNMLFMFIWDKTLITKNRVIFHKKNALFCRIRCKNRA